MEKYAIGQLKIVEPPLEEALAFVEKHHRQVLALPGKNLMVFGLENSKDDLLTVALFAIPAPPGCRGATPPNFSAWPFFQESMLGVMPPDSLSISLGRRSPGTSSPMKTSLSCYACIAERRRAKRLAKTA